MLTLPWFTVNRGFTEGGIFMDEHRLGPPKVSLLEEYAVAPQVRDRVMERFMGPFVASLASLPPDRVIRKHCTAGIVQAA